MENLPRDSVRAVLRNLSYSFRSLSEDHGFTGGQQTIANYLRGQLSCL